MLFDTDILIWMQKGHEKAAAIIEECQERHISVLTFMELLQCALNKNQNQLIKSFLFDYNFQMLPLTENIGHRAAIYIEEFSMSSGLRSGDAIIAATAIENNMQLLSGNLKHFKAIRELTLKVFKP